MADFLQTVRERVVIYDGAMGTNIHKHNPTLDDYWGKENCNEILVLSRPDIIRDVHASFLSVGCDVIETCFDLWQAKIATIAAIDAMKKAGKRLPLQVQVTLQENGAMLAGTEIGAALTALEPLEIDIIGLNCSTGPDLMNDAVRYLGL